MGTIDLESLAIFKAVVEEGGVVRAAAKLHRVPSNVTTRIRQLEEFLGVRLSEGRAERSVCVRKAARSITTPYACFASLTRQCTNCEAEQPGAHFVSVLWRAPPEPGWRRSCPVTMLSFQVWWWNSLPGQREPSSIV